MSELELTKFERELEGWRRRMVRIDPSPAMWAELEAAAEEIEAVRARERDGVRVSGDRLLRHFERLEALWNYLAVDSDDANASL